MSIYAIGDRVPVIHPDAFIHPDAVIIGDVRIGRDSSVWPAAVLRGDYGTIIVGEATSIQDGAVVHSTAILDTVVGSHVVVGHLAHLEGCVVEDGALIGSGSIVLHEATIGAAATVGAGAVITNRMKVPPGALAIGTPATIREGKSNPGAIEAAAQRYVANTKRYLTELRRLD